MVETAQLGASRAAGTIDLPTSASCRGINRLLPSMACTSSSSQTSELSGGLPFTGLGALGLALIGLLLFLGGRGLLIVGTKRDPRIPRSA